MTTPQNDAAPLAGGAGVNGSNSSNNSITPATAPVLHVQSPHLVLKRLSTVEALPVEWLWPGRIPKGMLTLLAGDPGIGKSTIASMVAARVTSGGPWPDGSISHGSGSVIWLAAEEDCARVLVPRLRAAGVNMELAHTLEGVATPGSHRVAQFTLADHVGLLESEIRQHPTVKLVVIDPITSYLGGLGSNETGDMRSVLTPLADLAGRHGVTVLVLNHLNKAETRTPLQRILGSGAFGAVPRAVLLVAPSPEDRGRRLLLWAKMSVGPEPQGLAYSFTGDPPTLRWESEPVTMSAMEALTVVSPREGSTPEREEAKEFLLTRLAAGPVGAQEVIEDARSAGISERTLKRAKRDLDVTCRPEAFGGRWVWELPGPLWPPTTPESATN